MLHTINTKESHIKILINKHVLSRPLSLFLGKTAKDELAITWQTKTASCRVHKWYGVRWVKRKQHEQYSQSNEKYKCNPIPNLRSLPSYKKPVTNQLPNNYCNYKTSNINCKNTCSSKRCITIKYQRN